MGINEFDKKYDLKDIVKGDSIFSATGITSGDLVSGIKKKNNEFITETLVTHKSQNLVTLYLLFLTSQKQHMHAP